jgi:hypothetical protein
MARASVGAPPARVRGVGGPLHHAMPSRTPPDRGWRALTGIGERIEPCHQSDNHPCLWTWPKRVQGAGAPLRVQRRRQECHGRATATNAEATGENTHTVPLFDPLTTDTT